MQLTAYVVDNETQEKVALDGAIQFLATNGSLGQSQVVLQNGEASVQLRSVSSLETIYSDITAKVVSNNELSGLVGNMKVEFVPELAEEVEEKAVKVVKAQTERADRIEIVLDKPKAELTKEELQLVAESLEVTNDVKGTSTDRKILEVRQVNDRVLEVLLDVYNEKDNRTKAEYKAENHLTDNVIHSIKVTNEVKDVLLPTKKGEELEFKLTDSTQQFALGAKGLDQRTIEVRFSEPVVAADLKNEDAVKRAGKHNAFDLSNYVLDGVELSDPDTKIDLKRDPKTGEVIGDGHIIQIDLRGKDVIREKNLILQVRNVGDWSSVTNEVNAITTQDLFLATDIDATKPVPSVMSQSPEQYMIELSQPVYVESSKKLEELIDVRYGEVLEEDQKAPGTGKKGDLSEQLISSGDNQNIQITALDKNGNVVEEKDIHDKNAPITAILVELTKDWTKIVEGKGYWQAAPQIQFKFAKNAFVTELGNKSEARSEYALNNVHDYVSPTIVKYAQQDIEAKDENGKDVILKNASGIADITFSEPVQIPGGEQGSGAPNTPNASQGKDVQSPVVEFSKDGVTVKGHIFDAKPADFDFSVAPGNAKTSEEAYQVLKDAIDKKNKELEDAAGEDWDEKKDALTAIGDWKLTITGVSDDYGNTMATQAFDYTVPADKEAEKDKPLGISPFVTYAEYEQIDDKDIIKIKFSEVMSNTDARGVGLVANYILNSQELSKVSGAKITKGITGVTNDWDGVTIELPKGSVTAPDFMLTLPTNFISKDDQMLTGANKLNFVKSNEGKSAYKPGLLLTNDEGLTLTEATAKAFKDLTIEGGSTVATDFKAGKDKDNASSLTATITFSGEFEGLADGPKGKKSPKAKEEKLQVTINDKVVTENANWAGQTLTVTLKDAEALKAAELDNLTKESRIEVKVNGQTVHVGILQDQSEIDAKKLATAKSTIEALDLKWDTDLNKTIEVANTAIDSATLPDGVTAVAAEGTAANAGKVVVTITSGSKTDSTIVIEAPEQTDEEKLATAKSTIEALDLKWDTDLNKTIEVANTAIDSATLPDGVTAVAAEGTAANAGKVVVTITSGSKTDSTIVIGE